jgi:hypothetical protein
VDAQEGVAGVAFAVEVVLDLGLLDVFPEMVDFLVQLAQEVGVLVDQLEIGLQLLDGEVQFRFDVQETVQDLLLLLQAGRFLGLVPDGGLGQLEVDFFYAVGFLGDFKETPEGRWLFSSVRRKGF